MLEHHAVFYVNVQNFVVLEWRRILLSAQNNKTCG